MRIKGAGGRTKDEGRGTRDEKLTSRMADKTLLNLSTSVCICIFCIYENVIITKDAMQTRQK